MEIKSTEFFRNMKTLPPPGTEEFRQLIKWEEEKILGGVNINGVHISGWLYWHLNHWWIRIDDVDEYGNDVRKECNPELRDNEWIRAEALEKAKNERKGYIEIGGRQGGKELADYEPVITENGLKPIGKIIPGDKIFSENGKLCTVTHVFPQGIKPIYRMYLADGRYVDSGLNHKWEVFDSANRRLIKTTEELIKGKISFPHKRSGTTYKYSIKETEEVQFSKKELPIPPYVLGALLGDGCTTGGTNNINVADLEIVEKLKKLLPEYDLNEDFFKKENGEISKLRYNIVYKGTKKFIFNKNPLNQALIELNLKCKAPYKFIPEIYKYSSVEDRYKLLRGIFDTDGSINSKGSIELKLSSKQLIDDVAWVLRSLGIQCRISTLDKRGVPQSLPGNRTVYTEHIYYRLYVRTDKPIFDLKRKLNKIKKRTKKNKTSIVKIEYLCDYNATCITVDNPSHLFLTKDFIVTHNSEMEASYFGMNAIMFQNTQNVIVCGNDNDLSLLKDKVDFGLRKLWKGLAIPRLDKTWRSNQVRLGYKTPDGDDKIWSYIIIRNAKDGHNTEVAAGTTAKSFIMDEVGKYSFSSAFKAAEPAFKGKNGWRAVPILVGTGGSFDNGKDAENFFYNPEANNFLTIENEDNSKTGLFLSGLYRQDCKYKTTLADYLINVRGMNLPDVSELSQIEMWVSDKDKALKLIEKERVAAKLHPDRTMYLKQVMYFPITVNECFLSASQNIFDVESAKHQKARLLAQEKTGTPVILYNDGEKITHKFTDKLPITNFPLKTDDSKDAPVVIYEFPIESPPYGLYVAGVDPYRQGQSKYSDSLGSVYIYKRMHDLTGEKYQDMFVASYCARPEKKEIWDEQARLLIKYYNARALVENDEVSFIDYMIAKGDAHYLEKQPDWLKEVVPNTTVRRDYGIHRSAEKIRDFLHTCLKKYLEEPIFIEKDENGNTIREILGVTKIFDPVLLEEIIQYNDDDNFDRVIAAELAIAQAMKMDPIFGKISSTKDSRMESLLKPKKRNVLFDNSRGLFTNNKNKLFR